MIISSEHHDLIEEFKKANEIEGEAIKALNTYMASTDADRSITMQLFQRFEDAHGRKMKLYAQLKELDFSNDTK